MSITQLYFSKVLTRWIAKRQDIVLINSIDINLTILREK